MTEVSLAIQAAVIAALKDSNELTQLVGARVYDRVPESARFPYVSLGPETVIEDGADDCVTGFEVFTRIDCWSRAVGRPECKNIAGAVFDALNNAALSVTGYNLLEFRHRLTRYQVDSDGLTQHGIVEFRSLIDAT